MKSDLSKLFLRVCFAGLMLYQHGLPKLLAFSQKSSTFLDPLHVGPHISMSLAIVAEFLCAALIIVGLLTRWASLGLVASMLVIIFLVHGADPILKHEIALLYLAAFATITIGGPGKFSLDSVFPHKKQKPIFSLA